VVGSRSEQLKRFSRVLMIAREHARRCHDSEGGGRERRRRFPPRMRSVHEVPREEPARLLAGVGAVFHEGADREEEDREEELRSRGVGRRSRLARSIARGKTWRAQLPADAKLEAPRRTRWDAGIPGLWLRYLRLAAQARLTLPAIGAGPPRFR
jgi:hypothetical protein